MPVATRQEIRRGRAHCDNPASATRPADRRIHRYYYKRGVLRYLASQQINEEEVGGRLSGEVSKTTSGQPATYFIIHDTSSPTLERGEAFPPAGIDTAAWSGNTTLSSPDFMSEAPSQSFRSVSTGGPCLH